MEVKKVYLLGGGTMGLDIAQVFARSGRDVFVRNTRQASSDAAKAKMEKNLTKLVDKGKMTDDERKAILGRLTFTLDLNLAAEADLVIEAAVENMDIKRELFTELDDICKQDAILATNTSSLSITEIGAVTKRPEQVIGMHFFNPAAVMKLVEIIRGNKTSQATYDLIHALCEEIGKTPVEVAEAPGFVVNRILIPMINEAANLLESGVAKAEDIDVAMQLGANHPMGPLHLGDLIGLDVCVAIMDTLYKETGDTKYRCSTLMRKLMRAGKLGRKTGEGFFTY